MLFCVVDRKNICVHSIWTKIVPLYKNRHRIFDCTTFNLQNNKLCLFMGQDIHPTLLKSLFILNDRRKDPRKQFLLLLYQHKTAVCQ